MSIKTVKDYPVYNKYWYLVDFKNLLKVKLFPYYFISKKAARRAKKLNFSKHNQRHVEILKGAKVKSFFLAYAMGKTLGKDTKYQYPDFLITKQERKNFRTIMRRRLRRMGLLTLVKPKKSIKHLPDYIKPIINKQKVANSPNSIARVFQIDRKPERYYYILLKRELAKKRGKLFKIKCHRYDSISGEFKELTIFTLRTDILIPYLITDLENLVYEKIQSKTGKARISQERYYASWGFKLAKSKEE